MTTIYIWVRPGDKPPAGFTFDGYVSRWQDTGAIRAELWKRAE